MTGGILDYDDGQIKKWTLEHPDDDITPLDFLYQVNKTYVEPGKAVIYSSVGYMMLGLALVQHSDLTTWKDFDQMSVLPENLRDTY